MKLPSRHIGFATTAAPFAPGIVATLLTGNPLFVLVGGVVGNVVSWAIFLPAFTALRHYGRKSFVDCLLCGAASGAVGAVALACLTGAATRSDETLVWTLLFAVFGGLAAAAFWFFAFAEGSGD
jgi:hypothetical protein